MKQPKIRLWIDAKGEKIDPAQYAEAIYYIHDFDQEETKQLFMAALYPYVREVILLRDQDNTVQVSYNPHLISPGFMDHLLRQRDLKFKRAGS